MTTTYKLEDVPPPAEPWSTVRPNQIHNVWGRKFRAMSLTKDVVDVGDHPVLNGFVNAFHDHRPITISPDIIWLLIVQGFTQHVLQNAEALRSKFVNFQGKRRLIVDNRHIDWYHATTEELARAFPQFVTQIAEYTGQALIDSLSANFSTSTAATIAATQVSIMAGMKEYFQYMRMMGGSGFPSVTIEGTVEDWVKLQSKAEFLAQYELEWWISQMRPILQEIVKTKSGHFNRVFWLSMIRHHERGEDTMDMAYIEGWMLKFFPYTKHGSRSTFTRIGDADYLPVEMLTVPIEVAVFITPTDVKPHEMREVEVQAGFVGLTQDPVTLNIKPEIGWIMYDDAQPYALPARMTLEEAIRCGLSRTTGT